VSDFFRTWLIGEDFAKAATYFSPRCYECIELYSDDGKTPPFLPEDQARYIQNSLAAVGHEIGPITRLEEALESVPPEGDDMKLMAHADKVAYSLVALPDYLADSFLCTKHSKKSPYRAAASGSPSYGNYYAAIFELRTPGEHASAVTLLWQKQDSVWRIVAYELMD
jgi:hypothetical protein